METNHKPKIFELWIEINKKSDLNVLLMININNLLLYLVFTIFTAGAINEEKEDKSFILRTYKIDLNYFLWCIHD